MLRAMRQMSGEDRVPLNESEMTRQRFMGRAPFTVIRGLYQRRKKKTRDGSRRPLLVRLLYVRRKEKTYLEASSLAARFLPYRQQATTYATAQATPMM